MRPYRSGSLADRVRAGEVPPDPGDRAATAGGGRKPRPSRRRWLGWGATRAYFLLTGLLHTIAFPPFNLPEAAFVFAVPVFLYTLRRPRWTEFLIVTYSAFLISWLVLLEWLRHVTIGGTIGVAAVMALFPTAWCAMVRWVLPRAPWSDQLMRLVAVLGLAAGWTLLEWTRSWFLTGFPWLPLAASMWQKPALLQGAAIGGAWLVSFSIIFFNLALGSFLQRMWLWVKERRGRFCPEFYLAIFLLFGTSFGVLVNEPTGATREPWFRAGFTQPYIPQAIKWDRAKADEHLDTIARITRQLAARQPEPDVILWPEAVTPVPLFWDARMRAWVEELADETDIPILFGALAFEAEPGTDPQAAEGRWSNGLFLVEPGTGLRTAEFYRKRHRVPFGEYVPLRAVLPFIEKFVPIGGDIEAGTEPTPLLVNTGVGAFKVGPLICYEDVFPELSRSAVRAGAEWLFVATNDAWYGETGAAYQHAAHSVLRAVETRRNVLRDGNGGWSGWIDEFGFVRHVVDNTDGSVYVRGSEAADITRSSAWIGRQSFYVQHGDWFLIVSAGFVILMLVLLRSTRFRFDPNALARPASPDLPGPR